MAASWVLLRDSGRILLEAAPDGMDMEQVRAHLAEVPHVLGVHDLHAWTVTRKFTASRSPSAKAPHRRPNRS